MTELYEHARAYIGTPWRDQGRSKQGLECVGLVIASARDWGVDLDPDNEITRHLPASYFVKLMRRFGFARVPDPRPSDIVAAGRNTIYIGILAPGSPLNVIHSIPERGVREIAFDQGWGEIRGFFRPCRSLRLD